jgi:hypothetical protein
MSMDFNIDPKLIRKAAESLAKEHIDKTGTRAAQPPVVNPAIMNQHAAAARAQLASMLENALDVKCEKCESTTFNQVWMVKRVSHLTSPNGKDITVPIQSFACTSCSHVNEEFTPERIAASQS